MKQILQSFKTGEMWLAEVPAPLCRPNGVVVKTAVSFVSAGTERMLAEFAKKGMIGKALQMPDQVKKVLRKIKTEGLWTTIEKVEAKLDQPIPLGYSMSGVVVEVGSKVQGISSRALRFAVECFADSPMIATISFAYSVWQGASVYHFRNSRDSCICSVCWKIM